MGFCMDCLRRKYLSFNEFRIRLLVWSLVLVAMSTLHLCSKIFTGFRSSLAWPSRSCSPLIKSFMDLLRLICRPWSVSVNLLALYVLLLGLFFVYLLSTLNPTGNDLFLTVLPCSGMDFLNALTLYNLSNPPLRPTSLKSVLASASIYLSFFFASF